MDHIPTSISPIADFLLDLFDQGKQVNSVSNYKSALSVTLPPIEGHSVGNHPLISKLFKGFRNLRPKTYKNPPKWEIDTVLTKLNCWGDNSVLTMKQLSLKLVMLLSLVSASRCSELSYLDVTNMTNLPDGIRFCLTKHKKNRSAAVMPGTLFFAKNTKMPNLCPVKCLQDYITRREITGQSMAGTLIRSYIKPFGPVTSSTISRWLSMVIKMTCFINQNNTIGHSVRGKAASKAMFFGLSSQEIMSVAEWKTNSVFQKFYYFPTAHGKFGRAVLNVDALNT